MRWLLVVLVACDAGSPPKPPRTQDRVIVAPAAKVAAAPDPWVVPTTRHKHAVRTADLSKPDLGVDLPSHGVVVKTWGLGGDSTLILDSEAGTIRELANLMDKRPTDHRRTVTWPRISQAMAAAYAAWDEEPNGEMPIGTDVREDLYVLDGDEAFYLFGHPIGADGSKGRPAAARALELIFALAPNR
ncbi:MAG TPA: hypothetical protein VIV58_20505 [Kofleriaceae bacterium]